MNTKCKMMGVVKSMVRCLPFYLFAFLLLSACSENDDNSSEFDDWQSKNTTYWNALYAKAQDSVKAGNTNWKIIKKWSLEDALQSKSTDFIIVHVKEKGTGTVCPIYTDTVRAHYTGRLIPSASYPDGYQFDSSLGHAISMDEATPTKLAVSKVVDGFSTALQNMHVGDRWEVYIPYTLGYGETAQSAIPAYSTLIFDIKLAAVYPKGQKVPDWK